MVESGQEEGRGGGPGGGEAGGSAGPPDRARGGRGGEAPVGEAGDAPPAWQCCHSGQSGALIPCCSHRYGVC